MTQGLRDIMLRGIALASLLLLASCGGGGGGSGAAANASAPAPPASFTADSGRQRVILNWSNVDAANAFTIYYGNAPGIDKRVSQKIEGAHSPYVLRDLVDGRPYYFAVASVRDASEGRLSAEVTATPSATPPPTAPLNVRAAAGNGRVEISWDASSGATSYTVYFKSASPVTRSDSPLPNAVSPQTVSSLVNGTPYYFAVSATNANGEGALSFEATATPMAAPPPPAPTGVMAVEGNGSVALTWNPVAGATAYHVYYAKEFGVTKVNGTRFPAVAGPSCTVTPLVNKTGYFLVVTAANANGESAESAQVAATPLAAKPLPALVAIPAGTFQMGDNLLDADAPAPYALPVRTVSLSGFHMDRYEVTYDLWKAVYDWALVNGYDFSATAGRNGSFGIGTNMPVTNVSWYDAVKWLNARSEREGRTPAYYTDATQTAVYRTGKLDLPAGAVRWTGNGYRLPTEAEWEYAARGGLAGMRYPWGNTLTSADGNYDRGGSTSVGVYPANGYGLHDMAGNVWEWTWNWSSSDYASDPDGATDPRGPAAGTMRVRRGGSYTYGERYLRCFERMFRVPEYVGVYFGFRAVTGAP